MQPTITLYKNAFDNTGKTIDVTEAIDTIRTGKLEKQIKILRNLVSQFDELKQLHYGDTSTDWKTLKKEYEEKIQDKKKKLPAVCWSAVFKKSRSKEAKDVASYSNLICIDIDKLPSQTLVITAEKLKQDPYTFFLFISPSGNGIKLIVKVAGTADNHLQNFVSYENYIKQTYAIAIDPSGKDISRLCFLSSDNGAMLNDRSTVFDFKLVGAPTVPTSQEIAASKLTSTQTKELTEYNAPSLHDTLQWIVEFTNKKFSYTEGSRNQWCYTFASNCCRKGIDQTEAEFFLQSFATDLPNKEVTDTVKKAYRHNDADFGKYAYKPKQQNNGTSISAGSGKRSNSAVNGNIHSSNGTNGNRPGSMDSDTNTITNETQFWKERKITKGKGEDQYTFTIVELVRRKFIRFLSSTGYFVYETDKDSYQVCHNTDGIIQIVDPRKIKNHVFNWCDKNNLPDVEEMLRKGQKNYFAYTELDSLPVHQPDFLEDTATQAFFFFRNCYVEVTATGIHTHKTNVNKNIWQTSIIDKDFSVVDFDWAECRDSKGYPDFKKMPCEMQRFICQVATNPARYDEISNEVVWERIFSICSSIGYMLHSYKTKIGKAVLAVDHKIAADKTEQNGGTGKSIVGESFKYLKGTCPIDGRDFDEKYPFRFEKIDLDTKIVVMMDCKWSLDFGSFFVPITNDFTFNKRHTGYITIPYSKSPKWWFDTNYVFKGEGASFRRRQHIIEFDDYYNDTHNPLDEFGHFLFSDWNAEQWNLFFNFYFQCVQLYLQNGLMDYPQANYDSRKLMVESNQEFIDWMDSKNKDGQYIIQRDHRISKKAMLQKWNNEARSLNMPTISPNVFVKWVRKYCSSKGYHFYQQKTNGAEYYIISEKEIRKEDFSTVLYCDLNNEEKLF